MLTSLSAELRSCVKVEVAVLGSQSLVRTVSVDVKQHYLKKPRFRGQELCESRGGRPGLPVPNGLYGLCGRKATLSEEDLGLELRSCMKVEVAVLGSTSLIVLTISVAVKKH